MLSCSDSPLDCFPTYTPGFPVAVVRAAVAAVQKGFAVVPCLPGSCSPLCTLPGKPKPHLCDHLITEEGEAARVFRRLLKVHGELNLAVKEEVGQWRKALEPYVPVGSGLVLVPPSQWEGAPIRRWM